MVVEYVRYAVAPARAEEFRRAWAEATALLQADPRCLAYEVGEAVDEPGRFVVRLEWDSPRMSLGRLRRDPAFTGLFALIGPYADRVQELRRYQLHTTSPSVPEKGLPTLYSWAGGHDAIVRLVDAFYDRVERDSLLRVFFPHGVGPEHREHVARWWSEVLGGPAGYTPLGGYPRMLAHHLDLDISVEQRRQFVALLSIAADDAALPDDPEFRAAIIGYAEWATRLALHNSKPGANVVREAPVPRWGWGVAPPYLP